VEGPAFTADAERLASRSVTLSSAAGSLEDVVDAVANLPPAPGGSGRAELMAAVLDFGNELPRDFEKDAEKIERWADRTIFTEGPDGVPLRSEATDRRGVVGALQNARAWSAADLDDAETLESEVSVALDGDAPDTATAIDRMQDFHDGVYRVWNPDAPGRGSPRPDASPLLLALAMNERVQQRWQALSNDVYASLATSNESVRTATAQVMASLHEGQFGDVSSKWNQFIAEYRRRADAEGTAVARQALDEVEVKATEAGRATEDALADARAALERAGEARTLGQRVLLESVGGAQFARAATIARLSQESVTGTWSRSGYLEERGILQNALAIGEAYRRTVDQAMSSGVELPSGLRAIDD
jgi:hypothetical protein